MKTGTVIIALLALAGAQQAVAQTQPQGGSAFTATPPGAVMPSVTANPTQGATSQPAPLNPATSTAPATIPGTGTPQIMTEPVRPSRRR